MMFFLQVKLGSKLIILLQTHRDSAKIKMLSFSAGNIMPASYVTGQSSHLTRYLLQLGRLILCTMLKKLETIGMVIRFLNNAANHMCYTHVADNQAIALEDCKNSGSVVCSA